MTEGSDDTLGLLFPEPLKVKIGLGEVEVPELTLAEMLPFVRAFAAMGKEGKAGYSQVVALGIRRPIEWVERLPGAAILRLFNAILDVNKDFFLLLKAMPARFEEFTNGLGPTPASASSPTDTAGPTSEPTH